MKNTIFLFSGLLLLMSGISGYSREEVQANLAMKDSITVFCSPDLYNMTTEWADGFCGLNSDVKIQVINVAGASDVENIDISKTLGFISGEYSEMYDQSRWNIVVGRDVIVPIFNSKNPFRDDINKQGISLDEFARIIENSEMKNWGAILNQKLNAPVEIYSIGNESIKPGMAGLTGVNKAESGGNRVKNAEELISAVQKDPYSIGICKMADIVGLSSQSLDENIRLLPIDRNGNGKIDYMEKIYDDLNMLSRGVWIGKYPKALFSNIYSISPDKPTNKIEVAFLKFVLTDGQQLLNHNGYSNLLLNERQTKIDLISDSQVEIINSNNNYAASKTILLMLASFVVLLFILKKGAMYIKSRKADVKDATSVPADVLDEDFAYIPLGLYFDKTHTWAFMEKDGLVKIGIDDFLQHITGPLTRVKMKSTGERVRKGKQVLSIIQNGKQLNIYAPISGTIKEQNKVLDTNSSLINSSPYTEGWVYRIEPSNWLKDIQFLIMGNKYKDWLKCEFSRLKEFLSLTIKPENVEYAPVLQDGGELKDGFLADLGPEVWEEFQTNFIDLSA